jgi:hypothetical protein
MSIDPPEIDHPHDPESSMSVADADPTEVIQPTRMSASHLMETGCLRMEFMISDRGRIRRFVVGSEVNAGLI